MHIYVYIYVCIWYIYMHFYFSNSGRRVFLNKMGACKDLAAQKFWLQPKWAQQITGWPNLTKNFINSMLWTLFCCSIMFCKIKERNFGNTEISLGTKNSNIRGKELIEIKDNELKENQYFSLSRITNIIEIQYLLCDYFIKVCRLTFCVSFNWLRKNGYKHHWNYDDLLLETKTISIDTH